MTSSLLEILIFYFLEFTGRTIVIYVWYIYYLIPRFHLWLYLLFHGFNHVLLLPSIPILIKLQVWIHELQTVCSMKSYKEVIWHMRWRLLLPKWVTHFFFKAKWGPRYQRSSYYLIEMIQIWTDSPFWGLFPFFLWS